MISRICLRNGGRLEQAVEGDDHLVPVGLVQGPVGPADVLAVPDREHAVPEGKVRPDLAHDVVDRMRLEAARLQVDHVDRLLGIVETCSGVTLTRMPGWPGLTSRG